MYIAKIWFLETDDFAVYGPFESYEDAQAWLTPKLATLTDDCRGDVFMLLAP